MILLYKKKVFDEFDNLKKKSAIIVSLSFFTMFICDYVGLILLLKEMKLCGEIVKELLESIHKLQISKE